MTRTSSSDREAAAASALGCSLHPAHHCSGLFPPLHPGAPSLGPPGAPQALSWRKSILHALISEQGFSGLSSRVHGSDLFQTNILKNFDS